MASSWRRIASAAEAGRDVLAEGGNAIEAMVAMAAAIAAVYPHMNHIGGDAFWLVASRPAAPRDRRGGLRRARARRRALSRATRRSRRAGRSRRSRCRARSAAGRWRAKPRSARRPACRSRRCSRRAIRARARRLRGHAQPGASDADKLDELKDVPGFAATFLVDGKPPAKAAVLRQTALAATLDQLARAGLDDFYRGDVGREIAADLERIGSPVTRDDLGALPRDLRAAAGTAARGPARSSTRRRRPRASPR